MPFTELDLAYKNLLLICSSPNESIEIKDLLSSTGDKLIFSDDLINFYIKHDLIEIEGEVIYLTTYSYNLIESGKLKNHLKACIFSEEGSLILKDYEDLLNTNNGYSETDHEKKDRVAFGKTFLIIIILAFTGIAIKSFLKKPKKNDFQFNISSEILEKLPDEIEIKKMKDSLVSEQN